MPAQQTYGSWPSPISAGDVARSGVGSSSTLKEIRLDSDCVYWLEPRPQEGGRTALMMRKPDGSILTLTPQGFNVRSRVHDYGGGAYCVLDGVVYFVNNDDQRIYRSLQEHTPVPITPPSRDRSDRFGDLHLAPDGRYLFAVHEEHRQNLVKHQLIAIDTADDSLPVTLHESSDFYSSPRISPDGQLLAWISWSHPHMPWDESTLMLARFLEGELEKIQILIEQPDTAVLQPAWSPEGVLHFLWDEIGWWNLYRWENSQAVPVHRDHREIASIPWVFGLQDYAFLGKDDVVWIARENGCDRLERFRRNDKQAHVLDSTLTSGFPSCLQVDERQRIWLVGASFEQPPAITVHDVTRRQSERMYPAAPDEFSFPISIPESILLHDQEGLMRHAFFYPPLSNRVEGSATERPPLIVYAHSGPTSAARSFFRLEIQYWTSRGFAVADVNYRGSTGFGRAFRHALRGVWGIADAEDCIFIAQHLAHIGKVDPRRMVIRGRSAGGFTALRALMLSDLFAGGTSYYGITDLERLQRLSGNFEAHYLEHLIGAYPAQRQRFHDRSPARHAETIKRPVLIIQGMEDPIVPAEQAERMVHVLQEHGLQYRYLPVEKEGHGFKRFESVRDALKAELAFYLEIFNLA